MYTLLLLIIAFFLGIIARNLAVINKTLSRKLDQYETFSTTDENSDGNDDNLNQ